MRRASISAIANCIACTRASTGSTSTRNATLVNVEPNTAIRWKRLAAYWVPVRAHLDALEPAGNQMMIAPHDLHPRPSAPMMSQDLGPQLTVKCRSVRQAVPQEAQFQMPSWGCATPRAVQQTTGTAEYPRWTMVSELQTVTWEQEPSRLIALELLSRPSVRQPRRSTEQIPSHDPLGPDWLTQEAQ
jgi:hypothetical protein